MSFVGLDGLAWVKKRVAERYEVLVPQFMGVHGWFDTWEKDRFWSMEQHLKPGMIFYDIGAYDGWQDAIISRFVGGAQNMVLVEPEPTNWPNIKATFDANNCGLPKATFQGFIGSNESEKAAVYYNRYPEGVDYSKLISHTTFRHIDENAHDTARTSLDTLASTCGKPDAINIDVEGAGLLVLQSAERTLEMFHPLIWVSIHDNEIFHHRPLANFPDEHGVSDYLKRFGYIGTFLANEHEEEWFFEREKI